MRYLGFALLLAIYSSTQAAELPKGFKGVLIGQTEQQVLEAYPNCSLNDYEYTKVCLVEDTIVGTPAKVFISVVQNQVTRISVNFHPEDFGAVVQAFESKYGKAQVKGNDRLQNRMGAQFVGRNYKWTNPKAELEVIEFDDSLDEAAAVFTTAASRAILEKALRSVRAKKAEDI